LFHPYQFVVNEQNVFKIGKTKQQNLKRLHNYPRGTILVIQIECINCSIMERRLINLFKKKFIVRRDLGYEYFEGNRTLMQQCIYEEVMRERRIHDEVMKERRIHEEEIKEVDDILDSIVNDISSNNPDVDDVLDTFVDDISSNNSDVDDISSDNTIVDDVLDTIVNDISSNNSVVDDISDTIVDDISSNTSVVHNVSSNNLFVDDVLDTIVDDISSESGNKTLKQFSCAFCEYKTSKRFNMEKHKKRKNTCSKHLASIRKKAEGEAEENKPLLICKICKKTFSRKDALQTHQKKINCNNLQLKQCKFCLKIFANLNSKYKHYKNVKCVPFVVT